MKSGHYLNIDLVEFSPDISQLGLKDFVETFRIRIFRIFGDEVENRDPPVEDAHHPHVVQQDREPVRLRSHPEVNLGLVSKL